jgi:hypothetical protein
MLQFFTHHFFQLKRCHIPQLATRDISAHRGDIAPPPPSFPRVTTNEAVLQKERLVFIEH